MNAISFLVSTIGDLYILCFLLRFLLQWVKADFHNPLSKFVVSVTGPLVRPVRRIIPGWKGLDLATIIVALALELALTVLLLTINGLSTPSADILLLLVLQRFLLNGLRLFFFAVLIRAILSWVGSAGYSPVTAILVSLTEPLIRPIRRLLPPVGGLDLAPLFVLLALQALILAVS
jgi:YggT family protein